MKFDCVIGNPPYENNKSYKFIQLVDNVLSSCGWVSLIIPAQCLTQPTKQPQRNLMLKIGGIYYIKHLPIGTFMKDSGPMKLLTIYYICNRNFKGLTRFDRHPDFEIDIELKKDEPWFQFYNDISRNIWNKCMNYKRKISDRLSCCSASTHKTHYSYYSNETYVHFSTNGGTANYVHMLNQQNANNTINDPLWGKRILSGVRCNKTNVKFKRKNQVRKFIRTDYTEDVIKWLSSHLFGMLMSICNFTHSNTNYLFQFLPLLEIENFDEFKAYKELGLNKKEIQWLQNQKNG